MKRGPLFSHLSSQNIQENTYFDSTWKGLTALGGLYFMFLVEHVLTLIKEFKDKKKKVRKTTDYLLCIGHLFRAALELNR